MSAYHKDPEFAVTLPDFMQPKTPLEWLLLLMFSGIFAMWAWSFAVAGLH